MRVLLVANYSPDDQKSMARYACFLDAELRKRGHTTEVVRPTPIATRMIRRTSRLFRWFAYLDKFVLFPPRLWFHARRADLVHICDHSNSFYLRWTGKTPNLITAHDALAIRSGLGEFPQNPTRWSGVKLQRWILRGLRGARHIVCVSQKTRQDFESLLPSGPAMTVIPNPLGGNFHPARVEDVTAIRQALGIAAGEEYLLHVGKDSWYKNRPGVFLILAELRKLPRFRSVKCVIAGAPLSAELRAMAGQGVVECVDLSDDQLRTLYSGALALLFPSLEEGFGWPILEAQACGCPVITTARPPMTEVAGGAAILIDPEDAAGAAAVIAERIDQKEALRQAGLANVRGFSVDAAMERYCEIYREAIAAAERRSARDAEKEIRPGQPRA